MNNGSPIGAPVLCTMKIGMRGELYYIAERQVAWYAFNCPWHGWRERMPALEQTSACCHATKDSSHWTVLRLGYTKLIGTAAGVVGDSCAALHQWGVRLRQFFFFCIKHAPLLCSFVSPSIVLLTLKTVERIWTFSLYFSSFLLIYSLCRILLGTQPSNLCWIMNTVGQWSIFRVRLNWEKSESHLSLQIFSVHFWVELKTCR